MKDVGIYDDTMIIVKSDHGNYIGEHNRAGKMLTKDKTPGVEKPWPHYDEVTHIPLMIKMPGQKEGCRITELVQPVDIFPTIMNVAGVETDHTVDGLSLSPLMSQSNVKWPRKYAFSAPMLRTADKLPEFWTTITDGNWSLMLGGEEDKRMLLYDLKQDPKQEHDVLSDHPDLVKQMGEAYLTFLQTVHTDPEKISLIEKRLEAFFDLPT